MTRSLLVLASVVWLGLASFANAQSGGGIAGTVKDAQGLLIPGVTVTLTGPSKTQVATTDQQGAYRFAPLPPGTYQVRFELAGFRTFERPDVAVTAQGSTALDVTLEIALMESVTVTAQKREENLQSVPVAITALTSQTIERARITDITDVQYSAPGINVGRAGEDIRPAIRGARTEQVGATNDPAVGFHVDGLYKGRPSQATNVFVDVDRIEIMRGPQGTLFGRNTFGGNVAVISKVPTSTFDLGAELTLGDHYDRKVNGFFNVPFNDKVQFRLAYDVERRDGYIKNNGASGDLWDEDMNYVRGILRIAPVNSFEVLVRATDWAQGGNGQGDFGYLNLGTVRDPTTNLIQLDGVHDPISPRRGTAGSVPDVSAYELNRDAPFTRDNSEKVGSVEATWLGSFVAIKSLTGFGRFHAYRANDGDYSSNVHAFEDTEERQKSWSEELTFSSIGTKRLTWVGGLFYLNDKFDYWFRFDRRYVACSVAITSLPCPVPYNPNQASYTTTIPNPSGVSSGKETLDVTSKAVFGQASVEIVKNLRATVGARYTKDGKTYSYFDEVAGKYGTSVNGLYEKDVYRSWSKTTWRAGLDYQLTPSNMLYGGVSTGYIAGGFAFSAPTAVYNPQNVTAYEVGSKNLFGTRTQMNVSAYYNDFQDLLANQFTTDPVTGAVFTYQINAGAVKSLGVEIETLTAPIDNLRLGVTLAFQNAEYGTFLLANPFPNRGTANGYDIYGITPSGTWILNLDGHQVQLHPTSRATISASYDFRTGIGTFTPIVQTYLSSSYTAWDLKIGRDGVNVQDAYSRTDLRLEWVPTRAQWRVQAYVQNVEDDAVLLRALRGGDNFIQGVYAAPRTAGVRLSYHFR
jgi:iron complex outermembrane receptor protein